MARQASPSSARYGALAGTAAMLLRRRWIVRAPIGLYRARLGFLFGSRLLMLEHTGRKSGRRRHVVLEIVDCPQPGTFVVASGFGTHSQWFRNVRADPRVRVWTRSRPPAPATARLLTGGETASALAAYAVRHPRTWSALKPVFEQTLGVPINTSEEGLPLVALSARADGPPGAGPH